MPTKIRLKFSKGDDLRFIGHLDFLRVFQQTIRRANIPVAYSQGFNPHILLSFALPLPLGMASENDYVDIVLETTLEKEDDFIKLVHQLNAFAPSGLVIKSVTPIAEGKKNAASLVTVADYSFKVDTSILSASLEGTEGHLHSAIKKLLSSETIIVAKKTKGGLKNTDIRQDIINIWQPEPSPSGEQHNTILMRLSAGSSKFLNPMLVSENLLETSLSPTAFTRLEMYYPNNIGELVPL